MPPPAPTPRSPPSAECHRSCLSHVLLKLSQGAWLPPREQMLHNPQFCCDLKSTCLSCLCEQPMETELREGKCCDVHPGIQQKLWLHSKPRGGMLFMLAHLGIQAKDPKCPLRSSLEGPCQSRPLWTTEPAFGFCPGVAGKGEKLLPGQDAVKTLALQPAW